MECEASFGTSTSSRNSEVIHAGLYYPTGSLKAQLCVDGRRKLYAYAAERGVPLRRCGKLVVASDESEIAAIEALHLRGQDNRVEGLRLISGAEARKLEPELHCGATFASGLRRRRNQANIGISKCRTRSVGSHNVVYKTRRSILRHSVLILLASGFPKRNPNSDSLESAIVDKKAVAAIMALVVHLQHEAGPETDRLKQSGVDVTG